MKPRRPSAHSVRGWYAAAAACLFLSLSALLWFLLAPGASEKVAIILITGGLIGALGAWTVSEVAATSRRGRS